jgi:hypothetical protein
VITPLGELADCISGECTTGNTPCDEQHIDRPGAIRGREEAAIMDLLSRAELERLAKRENGWHVSIFLPTHRVGAEIEGDRIRLKNLLAHAEQDLVAADVRSPEAQELL